jgi:hypothetical protein
VSYHERPLGNARRKPEAKLPWFQSIYIKPMNNYHQTILIKHMNCNIVLNGLLINSSTFVDKLKLNSNILKQSGRAVSSSISITFSLLIPSAGFAQSPFLSIPPGTSSSLPIYTESRFELQNSVACPTPTFSITGFGNGLNGWGDTHYQPYQSNSAGLGNYGIAAGVSVPLSNDLKKFCRDFAKIKAEFEKDRLRNQAINSQFSFFNHCKYFHDLGYDLRDDKWFKSDGPLSAFVGCRDLAIFLDPASRPNPTRYEQGVNRLPQPNSSDTTPFNPAPALVTPVK